MAHRDTQPGQWVSIQKPDLQSLIQSLLDLGYRVVGPQVRDAAIVYDDLADVQKLPIGVLDVQDGGTYRLREDSNAGYFDFVVGPHSLKNFLFPPRETLLELTRNAGSWQSQPPAVVTAPLAAIGVRACDLHALDIQDRVFLRGAYVDPAYRARREQLFLVAVNCQRAAATCFCHSMGTGPEVRTSVDLALTETDDRFFVQIGSAVPRQCRTFPVRRPLQMRSTVRKESPKSSSGSCTFDRRSPRARMNLVSVSSIPLISGTCCSAIWTIRDGLKSPSVAWPAATALWSAPRAFAARWRRLLTSRAITFAASARGPRAFRANTPQ